MKAVFLCTQAVESVGRSIIKLTPSPEAADFIVGTSSREIPLEIFGENTVFIPGNVYQLDITDVTNAPAAEAAPTSETEPAAETNEFDGQLDTQTFKGSITVSYIDSPRTAIFTIVEDEEASPADETQAAASQEASVDTQGGDDQESGTAGEGNEKAPSGPVSEGNSEAGNATEEETASPQPGAGASPGDNKEAGGMADETAEKP